MSKDREKAKKEIRILRAHVRHLDESCRNIMNIIYKIEDALIEEDYQEIVKQITPERGTYVRSAK